VKKELSPRILIAVGFAAALILTLFAWRMLNPPTPMPAVSAAQQGGGAALPGQANQAGGRIVPPGAGSIPGGMPASATK
jgi:hypothetical protein